MREDPFDLPVDVEAQLLGTCLTWPGCYAVAVERLTSDHFSRAAHRKTWELIARLSKDNKPLEVMGLIELAIEEGVEDQCGGGAYLTSLPEKAIGQNPEYQCGVLERAFQRRGLRDLASLIQQGVEDGANPDELRTEADAKLQALVRSDDRAWVGAAELTNLTINGIHEREKAVKQGRTVGWRTGLPTVDHLTGGIRPGHVWEIAGRPAMGKSALLEQVCLQLAADGRRVAFFSLEMTADVLGQRALANLASVNSMAIRDGKVTRDEWDYLRAAADRLYELPLHVDPRSASPSMIRARAMALAQRIGGIDVVAVDYIQCVSSEPGIRYSTRTEEIGAAAHRMQGLAKDLGCAVLMAVQLNRDVEKTRDKFPLLSNLAEAGALEQVADVVIGLCRPEYYDQGHEGEIRIELLKARHGKPGVVWANWNGAFQQIREKAVIEGEYV